MTEWVCRWKPFWVPSGDTFKKAYLEEWERVNDEQRPEKTKPHPTSRTTKPAKLQKAGRDESNTTREQPCDAPLYRSLRGKRLENQTNHHGNIWGLREVLHFGNHWVRHRALKNVFATALTQSNSASSLANGIAVS